VKRSRQSRLAARALGIVAATGIVAGTAQGCSIGEGTGSVTGVLDVPTCWVGAYDLKPDFFAAIPTTNVAGVPVSTSALQIRIQHGGDFESFSDGLSLVVDDVNAVRGDSTRPSLLGHALSVGLPAGVRPPGVPIIPAMNPSLVHATLYLDQTCRTQNVALYALDAVTLPCDRPPGGDPVLVCGTSYTVDAGAPTSTDAGAATDAAAADDGSPVTPVTEGGAPDAGDAGGEAGAGLSISGTSTITFNSLFDGNPDESNAAARLTDATFHFYLADPREICPGGLGPPPKCRGELTGNFHFYFERGKPAQPYP
jgi:hypothetical protein